jgi:signal transduction histidine kinase
MFRRFRHKLLAFLQAGIFLSAGLALCIQPEAWRAVAICALGASLVALIVGRIARLYLHATLGRLRRVADDVGHGRPAAAIDVQPGDDMYKLTGAVNLLAQRLADAAREEQRLHDELRRRERLAFLGELAASVAHEVNNPLDGVQNCVRILRRSAGDPVRAAQMLDLIDSGLGRIELIVRRLLTLGRAQALRPSEARLSNVVDGAVASVMPRLAGRGVEVSRALQTDDDRALVDRALVEQVFVNLLLNAADSMTPGGRLTITVRREELAAGGAESSSAARICVDVADTGTGISPDVLPHIFEPFFTTKADGQGTGLGLAIAARILDAHHGDIQVASPAGGGSVFTVRIPAPVRPPPQASEIVE